MSANVIIFDGMYTVDQMRNIDKARTLIEEAVQELRKSVVSHRWKCPEAREIEGGYLKMVVKLNHLNQGVTRTGIALGNGLKGFAELEDRATNQAEGLASSLKEKTGVTISTSDGENITLPSTMIPTVVGGLGGLITSIGQRIKDFFEKILKPSAEQRRQDRAKKLEDFFKKNFPWFTQDDTATVNVTPTPTPAQVPTPTTTVQPTPEPEPVPDSTPEPQPQSGGWDASGGWDTVGDSFPNKRPDFNSVYYNGDNPTVRQRAYGKEGRHGADSIDCCFYARARAMEVNGWTKTYGTYTPDESTDAVKAGNRVVMFYTGNYYTNSAGERKPETHFVFVEHYDPSTDTVYFSDSNMGGSPATDGSLKSRSFSDFLNYFPSGRYAYTENP